MINSVSVILEQNLTLAVYKAVGLAFLAGVLTSFTPCVYPLIPITAGLISAQTLGQKSKLRIFLATSLYVLGVSLIYALLGVVSAATGTIFGQVVSARFFNIVIGIVMIFFGLNMLDLFYLKFPEFLQKRLVVKNLGFLGIFLMGLTSGFVFAPCTVPALGVLLTYISTTHNILLGSLMMFSFSLGLCVLLFLVGIFSGFFALLPKSGKWMVVVKKILGIVMILIGIYYFFRI